ncbi:MAG: restriction endonuclease subunit S [Alphaproteobacteria bacterium]|nr:restriction endonuclease subunit S [Alphaproteobacteria bacterium]
MTDWQKIKLGDISEVIGGGTPSTKNYDFWNGDIPWLTPKDLSGYNNRYVSRGERNITKLGLQNSSARMLPKGTVLLTSRAPIGYLAIAENDVCTNQGFKSIILKDGYCPEFFYYLLKNNIDYIIGMGSGSTFAEISGTQVKNLEFTVPPIDIQKKIAEVLGALDDKIELNNKINNNLEQQAQALIQEHTINLQTIIPLDEFCNIFTGRKNANEFDKNGVNKFFTCGPEALSINSYIYDGPAVIISGNGAYTGRTRFYNGRFDLYQRTYACTLKEKVNSNYIYLLYPLLKMVLEKKLMGGTHGSAIPYIVMNDIAKFEVPFDKEIFDKISPACKAIIDKIQTNEQENEKLSVLRDTLLPKLMSGEIDVSKVNISADKLSFTEE